MKKYIILLISVLNISYASEDEWILCSFYADRYASEAQKYGKLYESVVRNTAPNSPDRREALKILENGWEKLEDDEYMIYKSLEKNRRERGWTSADIALSEAIRRYALSAARLLSISDYGKTEVFYRRKIESDCRVKK